MRILVFLTSFLLLPISLAAPLPCVNSTEKPHLSARTANYIMKVTLDDEQRKVRGSSRITWINRSDAPVDHVRMYMYLNAFSNARTSYLKDGRGIGAEEAANRSPQDWGWVTVHKASQSGAQLTQFYTAPTDGNADDKTVLELALAQSVQGGDTLTLDLEFESKLPRIMARTGFAEHGFMHWVHWYPKLGVYEQREDSTWWWNCHQFLPGMEFFGNHGNYRVTIDAPSNYTIGGTGCLEIEKHSSHRSMFKFEAHDVIDFGWVASPHLQVIEDQWQHVHIRLLHPPSHKGHAQRLLDAATYGLGYMANALGAYPYNTLTILDPPVYGLRSGFMEYPTYITGGSFYAWPKQIRTIESLILHEFLHQYFMQIVANNEKEEPWLDEGFVTYYEDRVMEAMLGENSSLFDVFGYHVANSDFTRNEYVSIAESDTDPIATRSWEIDGPYKGIIYSKTATLLKTIENYIGRTSFDQMMKSYFDQFKFAHPKGKDFTSLLEETLEQSGSLLAPFSETFIEQTIHSTGTCDYAIDDVVETTTEHGFQQEITFKGTGDLKIPVELEVVYQDGIAISEVWDGQNEEHHWTLVSGSPICSVEIDPHRKNLLDLDLNNNSYSCKSGALGRTKYASKMAFWYQQILNTLAVML